VRPIETGDWVVYRAKDLVTLEPEILFSEVTSACMSEIGNAHLVIRVMRGDMGLSENVLVSNVITIRKPRKGGKEARDIVAMLCKEYRRFLNDSLRPHLKFKADCVAIRAVNKEPTSIRYVLYSLAKSKLGALNE